MKEVKRMETNILKIIDTHLNKFLEFTTRTTLEEEDKFPILLNIIHSGQYNQIVLERIYNILPSLHTEHCDSCGTALPLHVSKEECPVCVTWYNHEDFDVKHKKMNT